VKALDAYTAAMPPPSTGNKALGANSCGGVKPYPSLPKPAPRMYYQRPLNPDELPQTGQKPDAINRWSIRETPKTAPVRRCFICKSPDHIALNCLKQTTARQYKFGSSTPRAASNACMVEKVNTKGQLNHDIEGESLNDIVVIKDTYHSAVDSEQSLVPDNAYQKPTNNFLNITNDSVGHLSFCDVEIKGLFGSVRALDDSGTQLNLVNPKVIDPLNLPRFGKVVVRGAVGDAVCARLVKLQLRLPEVSEYTGVTCVVRDGFNLDLILVADIVTKLSLVRNKLFNDMPDMVNVDVDVVNVTAINAAADDHDAVGTDHQDNVSNINDSADEVLNGDDVDNLITDDDDDVIQSTRTADTQQIIHEQHKDRSLAN